MKFKEFLEKAKKVVPEIAKFGINLTSQNYLGAISQVGKALLGVKGEKSEEANVLLQEFEMRKSGFEFELEKLYLEDRKDSRKTYILKGLLHNIYAIVFLIGYFGFGVYVLDLYVTASRNKIELEAYVIGFVGTFIGFIGAKLSTIIDFLFGASKPKEK